MRIQAGQNLLVFSRMWSIRYSSSALAKLNFDTKCCCRELWYVELSSYKFLLSFCFVSVRVALIFLMGHDYYLCFSSGLFSSCRHPGFICVFPCSFFHLFLLPTLLSGLMICASFLGRPFLHLAASGKRPPTDSHRVCVCHFFR